VSSDHHQGTAGATSAKRKGIGAASAIALALTSGELGPMLEGIPDDGRPLFYLLVGFCWFMWSMHETAISRLDQVSAAVATQNNSHEQLSRAFDVLRAWVLAHHPEPAPPAPPRVRPHLEAVPELSHNT